MRQAIVIAIALLVACKSPATKVAKARDELASWAAAGAMLSSAWSQGTAATPYVKSTVKVGAGEVDKLRQPLQSDSEGKEAVQQVANLYGKLLQAVEQNDRPSAAKLAGPFSAISRRVKPQS